MADLGARLTRLVADGCAAALLWGAGSLSSASAAQLLDAQVTSQPQVTRIQIESDAPLEFQMFGVPSPDRVVLDLSEAKGLKVLEAAAARLPGDDPLVKSLRVGRFKPTVLRVVLDLRGEAMPHAYRTVDAPKGRHRLVLDLYPPVAPDGISALLQSAPSPTATPARKPAAPSAVASAPSPQAAPDRKTQAGPETVPSAAPAESVPAPKAPIAAPAQATAPAPVETAPRIERTITVAIDAGHGGEDPGATGHSGTFEKDVTLAIARRLKAAIDAMPNMRGVLIRDGDHFVALHQRVVKARSVEADLFVSIHADAFIKPNARGSSVFALSERGATSAAARWLAKKENDADLIGGINLDVPDPNLKKVLLDLSQTATINDSLRLGRAVLRRLSEVNDLHKRHVEQAGFAVLKAPDIPSILVETAFISNPEEEKRLNDEAYQGRLTQAIAEGIRQYFAKNPPLARVARSDGPPARSASEPAPAVGAADPAVPKADDRSGAVQKVAFTPPRPSKVQPARAASKSRSAPPPLAAKAAASKPPKAEKAGKRQVATRPAGPSSGARTTARACCRPAPTAASGLRLR